MRKCLLSRQCRQKFVDCQHVPSFTVTLAVCDNSNSECPSTAVGLTRD